MRSLAARLPEWARTPLRRARDRTRAVFYHGTGRYCPVCGRSSRRFRTAGFVPREDAQCAHCGALERHRLLWVYVSRSTDLFDGRPKTVLHVAPEACLESRFRQRLGRGYITADLHGRGAMVRMDITHLACPDECFDVIFCSHVLEHVPDDRRAMRELCRVLKRDGWAILLVPIGAGPTFEDPSVVAPRERVRLFGQHDHVRRYGPDYVDRLREAGFDVKTTTASELVEADEKVHMGLTPASGDIYHCTRRIAGTRAT